MTSIKDTSQTVCEPEVVSSVFASIVSISLGVVYALSRLGFDDTSPFVTAKVLAIGFFFLFFPYGARRLLAIAGKTESASWYTSYPWLTVVAVIISLVAGLFQSRLPFDCLPVFLIIGVICAAASWRRYLRCTSPKRVVVSVAGIVFFSLWVAKMVFARGYQNPLFGENIVAGSGHIDTLFHASMSQMIRTYGIPSTGLDGIPYIPYHFGSHWVFAQLSELLALNPLDFYQIGYPLIFPSLLIHSLVLFAIAAGRALWKGDSDADLSGNYIFWLVFASGMIGFLPSIIENVAANWNGIVISESYCLAITAASFLCSLLLQCRFSDPDARSGENLALTCAALPFLVAVVTLLKVSVGVLITSLVCYLFLRLRLYKSRSATVSVIVFVSAALAMYELIKPGQSGGLYPFHFIRENVIHANPTVPAVVAVILFFVFHFMWSWAYIIVRIVPISDFLGATAKNSLKKLDIEAVVFLSLLGLLPGMILPIEGGSAAYFSDIQKWIAFPLMLGMIQATDFQFAGIPPVLQKRAVRMSVVGVLIAVLGVRVTGATRDMIYVNLEKRGAMVFDEGARDFSEPEHIKIRAYLFSDGTSGYGNSLLQRLLFLKNQPQDFLRKKTRNKLLLSLRELASLPPEQKRKSLLYIPKTNRLYWEMLPSKMIPFVAPAVAGIAMIRGLPEPCEVNAYGYAFYEGARYDESQKTLLSAVLAETASLGVSYLHVIDLDSVTTIKLARNESAVGRIEK